MERDQALKFMHDLLRLMVQKNGSDLFITAGFPPAIKVDGKIVPVQPVADAAAHGRTRARDHERPPGGRVRGDQGMQLRHFAGRHRPLPRQCLRAAGRVGCRAAHHQPEIPTLEELGLPPVLKEIAMAKRGLVIFVGGTGTGKTTSLAALVDYRNENTYGHIITIEDPIEFVHEHKNCIVTQREVGVDTETGKPR
jgi:twitching motility protein PilU